MNVKLSGLFIKIYEDLKKLLHNIIVSDDNGNNNP